MLKEYGHYHYEKYSVPKQRVYMEVYKALRAHKEKVRLDMPEAGMSSDEVYLIVKAVCDDTPSFYYVNCAKCELYAGRAQDNKVKYFFLKPKYLYSEEAVRKIDDRLEAGLRRFCSNNIHPGMSDYEKELRIHDYLVDSVSYDSRVGHTKELDLDSDWRDYSGDYNILGPLVRNVAVCDGISDAFKVLCDYCNMPCIRVSGYGQKTRHAWNIVEIDHRLYHVDVTWDLKGGRRYLNLSDRQLARDHKWDRSFYPPCKKEWPK